MEWLLGNHATRNPITGITGRIRLAVVRLRVNYQGCSAIAEDGVRTAADTGIGVRDRGFQSTIRSYSYVFDVACVWTRRILQTMMLLFRIEMRPG